MKTIKLDSLESNCPSAENDVTYIIATIEEVKSINLEKGVSDYEYIFDRNFKHLEDQENIFWKSAFPRKMKEIKDSLKGLVFYDYPNEKYPEPTEDGFMIVGARQDELYFYISDDTYVGVHWSCTA